jgi:RND family efflux transporter MFP subunit
MKLHFFNFPSRLPSRVLGAGALTFALGLGVLWAAHRARAQAPNPEATAAPVAGVSPVTREDLAESVTIPAEFRPYLEVSLHAKVSGYVSQMKVDFGDRVKAGQLVATLEVPELRAELDNALAAEQKTQADYTNADLIYTRLQSVDHDHPHLIAQQDLDTAQANALTAAAAIAAAKAIVEKFQTLVSYLQITAPFDGVVTHRYADPGTLIQAGTSSDTQAMPLVRISDNYLLRLDFPVSVDYVKDIQVGDPVTVQVDSLNGHTLIGKVTRFTDDIDDHTRTMITEIEVPNPDLQLVPGMYAKVILKVARRRHALAIPVQAISSASSPTVLRLDSHQQVEECPVQLGLRTPDKYEVISGVNEGDLVIVGNRAQFQSGEKVEPRLTPIPEDE